MECHRDRGRTVPVWHDRPRAAISGQPPPLRACRPSLFATSTGTSPGQNSDVVDRHQSACSARELDSGLRVIGQPRSASKRAFEHRRQIALSNGVPLTLE